MEEPSPRSSRQLIAGSLAALVLIGGAGFLLGRNAAPPPPTPPAPIPAPAPAAAPIEPTERVLNRADLIAIGNTAADALASGGAAPAALGEAVGQRFELYLPFGCAGPAAEGSDALLRWRYDAEAKALRVRVAPSSWPITDWWPTRPANVEALEGFWIARPWSSRETCVTGDAATPPPGTAPITFPGQTLGIAQVVTSDTPRQLRRDAKPYESVVRVAPEALRVEAGLRVRLRGRIENFPGAGPARCVQPGGQEQRPVCLLAVSIDEVAIDNPATEETLATWSPTIGAPAHAGQ